jgi:outer membrane biosynthesis protein TonB
MTIEASLDRIAAALEALVEKEGIVLVAPEPQQQLPLTPAPEPKPVVEDDDLDDFDEPDLEDDLADIEDEPAPPPKKKAKKKAAKKKAPAKKKRAAKPTQVGSDDESEFSEGDVREKLKELQLTSGDARLPKSILKRNGASTLKGLDAGKRGNVIAEIDAELEQFE